VDHYFISLEGQGTEGKKMKSKKKNEGGGGEDGSNRSQKKKKHDQRSFFGMMLSVSHLEKRIVFVLKPAALLLCSSG